MEQINPPDPYQPSEQLRYLYDRWQTEEALPRGSMADQYHAAYEKEAGIYVAKLLKRKRVAAMNVVPPVPNP